MEPQGPTKQEEPPNPFTGIDKSLMEEIQTHGGMQYKAMHLIMRNLPKTNDVFRNAVLQSPFFPWLPEEMFVVSLANAIYTKYCQKMGRLLLERDQQLLKALIEHDLSILKKVPNITVRQVRAYYFYKYALQNRETLQIAN